MDPFAAIMLGLIGLFLVSVILLGLFYPGTGAEQLGWRRVRSAQVDADDELDDLAQMLDAANERRRRRGARERTLDEVERDVRRHRERLASRRATTARREDFPA